MQISSSAIFRMIYQASVRFCTTKAYTALLQRRVETLYRFHWFFLLSRYSHVIFLPFFNPKLNVTLSEKLNVLQDI